MLRRCNRGVLTLILSCQGVQSFHTALFQESPTLQKTAPSRTDGVDIEFPDFDELFSRIQTVSPLAKSVIQRYPCRGFAGAIDSSLHSNNPKGTSHSSDFVNLPWRSMESNKRRIVHQIDRIDHFNSHSVPLLRFRASMTGPCIGECFGNFIMDYDERRRWDPQIQQVYEIYPLYDLDSANIAMGFGRYGDCSRLGVGYCQTKANFVVSPREQLTLCGVQEFEDRSCIIWGVELEEWHNHLLPPGPRHVRAKSHLFSTTLSPTSENSFDVEYILQLDVGGRIPAFLTTPIIVETVKSLFQTADRFFSGKDGKLGIFLSNRVKPRTETLSTRLSLLMTP